MKKSIGTHGLPPIRPTISIPHVYRFVFNIAGKANVTFANLGSLFLFAKTSTTSGEIWTRVKLKGVRMFGVQGPNTIKLTYNGVTPGMSGNDVQMTDSSLGSTYIAAIPSNYGSWVKPGKSLQVSQWQSCASTNTAIAFTVESDQAGAYIDVKVVHECPTDNTTDNNTGPAIAGATAGDVFYIGLDGVLSTSSLLRPVGPDNLL